MHQRARRLKQWIIKKGLPLNRCGKIIVPTKECLDKQLDVLMKRGQENGAEVELWNENKLADMAPEVRTMSGRALWVQHSSHEPTYGGPSITTRTNLSGSEDISWR